jgi:conserved hypothetical protein
MDKINTVFWDELMELPTSPAVPELLGFLDALPCVERAGVLLFSCRKLAAGRRMLKLARGLNEDGFHATMNEADTALELDRERGKALFRISGEAHRRIAERRDSFSTKERWVWLRGIWGGCGSLYLLKSGYYANLRLREGMRVAGEGISRLLRSADILPGVRRKQGYVEYMLRNQEHIVTCLTKMKFAKCTLRLEDTAIVRSVRSRANKLVNCDTANIGKALQAARAQMEILDRIEAEGLWDSLPPTLAELAQLRRANPSASLRELGQNLSKPVSKSTVEYRWKRLESLAKGSCA